MRLAGILLLAAYVGLLLVVASGWWIWLLSGGPL